MPTLRVAFRSFHWLLVVLLAICLALQAVPAAVNAMLGPRHTHQMPGIEHVVASKLEDAMAGWADFRRMQWGDADRHSNSRAHTHAHAHAHGSDLRHHHELGDPSVIQEDAFDVVDRGLAADSAQAGASFLFMVPGSAPKLAPPEQTLAKVWRAIGAMPPSNPDPWRIERPPQALQA